ncbi:hypothetical protein L1049_016803 [Liquidambar formosana]|uniref:DUF7731 domain-containing protein n=1 Tax=Liquidambar formosana TaxID=63359 RepID=A0AAP0S6Y6_LIQFO
MAFSVTIRHWVLVVALLHFFVFGFKFGKAEEELPQTGSAGDPAQIVAKALLCFHEDSIYISCNEAYRLTESGNINVPYDHTDEYCNGPCLMETHLVLNCIEGILLNFEFYNKATIQDIRDTIQAGCGHTSERGNFNVAEHIQAEESKGNKAAMSVNPILFGLVVLFVVRGLFL